MERRGPVRREAKVRRKTSKNHTAFNINDSACSIVMVPGRCGMAAVIGVGLSERELDLKMYTCKGTRSTRGEAALAPNTHQDIYWAFFGSDWVIKWRMRL